MFIGAQFKGCKRPPGRFLDNEMSWLRMQKDILKKRHTKTSFIRFEFGLNLERRFFVS